MAYVIGKFETKARILAMKPSGLLASFATISGSLIRNYWFQTDWNSALEASNTLSTLEPFTSL